MPPRPYVAHDQLIAPARRHPQLWRLGIGLVLIAAVSFGLNSTLSALLMAWNASYWAAQFRSGLGNSPLPLLVMLGSFGFVTLGVFVAARLLQKRSGLSLLGPLWQTLRQFRRVLIALIALGAVLALLPPYAIDPPLTKNLALPMWLSLLPLSLMAVLVQASAEEILFRGYIQQALAARFSNPLIWMILPSVLFALGHYLPTQAGDNAVPIAIWAGLFGILMADLTARAGTLGPAIAVHLANNVTALIVVSLPDSLSGLALYVVAFDMADTEYLRNWLVVDFAMMFVTWLAARLAIRR
ncbi:CPBP family intramembrane glutamic endopeptidase [Pontibaca salina]|uniref:CPBP family intramembrane metalloprotease n=1 Tax=Pontibaca salina TaxID=2795731 RepID=A0A934HTK6_9RHOB|nr:type II CAAX endopeptidase family protein [Pontibaca salina]MBI6629364.1 CPBP family intramembrane metalloprotease [Pontibaca salina]